jgi:chorismate synthase
MNTFGRLYRLTSFGESHGVAVGGVIDGCPPGLELDLDLIQNELNRRRPGQSRITTPRVESDTVEFLSGVFEGKTTGTPIGFIVKNENQQSNDYSNIKDAYRPSHADFTYHQKYGIRDYRGGGRSSARETIARIVGGAVAKLYLDKLGIDVIKSSGYRIGPFEVESAVMTHPAVVECAITGVPDEIRGQVIKATIVLSSEYKSMAGEDLAKEIQDHVKNVTAPYKYPRVVEFVDELPKTISGKIRRVEIRSKDK